MTIRKEVLQRLIGQRRSASSLARELGLRRADMEDELRHVIRSAEAHRYRVNVEPAACKACGFRFDERKLAKPSRCPACRGNRLYEAQITIEGELD